MAITKYCAPCRSEVSVENFNKSTRTYDGLAISCKPCSYRRYGPHAVRQRSIPLDQRDPFDRKHSRSNAALNFLEKLLEVYGPNKYHIDDKTIKMLAEDARVSERAAYRYLKLLQDMKLIKKKYHNPKNRSLGYDWFILMNKPSKK